MVLGVGGEAICRCMLDERVGICRMNIHILLCRLALTLLAWLAQPFLGKTVPNCRYVLAAVPVMPGKAAPPTPSFGSEHDSCPIPVAVKAPTPKFICLSSRGIPSPELLEINLLDLGIQGCLSISLLGAGIYPFSPPPM